MKSGALGAPRDGGPSLGSAGSASLWLWQPGRVLLGLDGGWLGSPARFDLPAATVRQPRPALHPAADVSSLRLRTAVGSLLRHCGPRCRLVARAWLGFGVGLRVLLLLSKTMPRHRRFPLGLPVGAARLLPASGRHSPCDRSSAAPGAGDAVSSPEAKGVLQTQ